MLTENDLLNLIANTETFRIEKTVSVTDTDKFCQAICAFSNDMPDSRKPGYLLLGVTNDNKLSGLRANDEVLKSIAGLRTDGNILPLPSMTVQHFSFDDGDVIVVEVQPSMEPPVRFRGRTWIRVGPRKDTATIAEENLLADKRQSFARSFDMSPCMDATIDDIDTNLFLSYYLPLAVSDEALDNDGRSVTDKMASLRLYDKRYERPTNAAVLLFGKDPCYFFPGAYVQFVEFNGDDNSGDITNENEFKGNLMTILPKLKTFVETTLVKKRPVPISALQEKKVSNYPEWAIRELLMNAIMHRDYRGNTPVKLYCYSGRLEIVNPGGLYGNARPENFPDVNDYRNPVVSEALKILGYVNKYNRGIARVIKELKDNGNGEAEFTLDKITVFAVKVKESVNKVKQVKQDFGLFNFDKVVIYRQRTPANVSDANVLISSKSLKILRACAGEPKSRIDLLKSVGLTVQTNNFRNHIFPLISYELIKKTNINVGVKEDQYALTDKGVAFLNLFSGYDLE